MEVIKVNNITKKYNLYKSSYDRFKEALNPLRKKFHNSHYVLKNISFSVNEGDVLGIIGRNGCGKSTILKILAGVLTQTTGECLVHGKVSALLELGSGFNPEYTGIENIYFSASIMGFSKKEIDAKLNDIVEFADIGEYIHQPVKTYSSGMAVRLSFAVSINIDPDILIIDEALSVGDIRFQQKSLRKMQELMQKAKAIIFVTHDMGAILSLCNRVIWLKEGEIFQEGLPDDICKDYISFMSHNQISTIQKKEIININKIPDAESHKHHIDSISLGQNFLHIEGWCINTLNNANHEVSLHLANGEKEYLFETDTVHRPDVTKAFEELEKNFDNSGFTALCPNEILEEGDFDLYLILSLPDESKVKLFINTISRNTIKNNLIHDSAFDKVDKLERYGNNAAEIKGVSLKDSLLGSKLSLLSGGEQVDYFVKILAKEYIELPILGIIIKDNYGNQIMGINSFIYNQHLTPIAANTEIVVRINFNIPLLREGVYTISPAISNGTQDDHVICDWIHDATIFELRTGDIRQKIGVIVAPENVIIEMKN